MNTWTNTQMWKHLWSILVNIQRLASCPGETSIEHFLKNNLLVYRSLGPCHDHEKNNENRHLPYTAKSTGDGYFSLYGEHNDVHYFDNKAFTFPYGEQWTSLCPVIKFKAKITTCITFSPNWTITTSFIYQHLQCSVNLMVSIPHRPLARLAIPPSLLPLPRSGLPQLCAHLNFDPRHMNPKTAPVYLPAIGGVFSSTGQTPPHGPTTAPAHTCEQMQYGPPDWAIKDRSYGRSRFAQKSHKRHVDRPSAAPCRRTA